MVVALALTVGLLLSRVVLGIPFYGEDYAGIVLPIANVDEDGDYYTLLLPLYKYT